MTLILTIGMTVLLASCQTTGTNENAGAKEEVATNRSGFIFTDTVQDSIRSQLVDTNMYQKEDNQVRSQQPRSITSGMRFRSSYSEKVVGKKGSVRNNQNRIALEGNSYDLMEFSRGIGALLTMYEASDSLHYLEEALDLSEQVIGHTKRGKEIPNNPKMFKDKYKGWVNVNPDEENNKRAGSHLAEVPLFESYLFRYLAKMAYMIEKTENIPPAITNRGKQLLDFVEVNGWEKWYERGELKSPGCFTYLFRNRTHITSHWALTALYLQELSEKSEKKQQYKSLLKMYDDQLKKNLRLDDHNAYVWNMTWDYPWPLSTNCNPAAEEPIIQDVSHGNQVVNYVVEAYEMGTGAWAKKDIQAFSNTVKHVIYDSKENRFNGDLNGQFIAKVASGIQMADGFIKLARYDQDLLRLFENVRVKQYDNYEVTLYEPQYVAEVELAEKYFRN